MRMVAASLCTGARPLARRALAVCVALAGGGNLDARPCLEARASGPQGQCSWPSHPPPSGLDVFLPSRDEGGAGPARPIRMGVDHCLFQDAEQIAPELL